MPPSSATTCEIELVVYFYSGDEGLGGQIEFLEMMMMMAQTDHFVPHELYRVELI